ncbi:MAG: efflux transporter periplasmic adaptor subunit [Flavobacterium sp. MedPE-SWcel]|uniref:efflux RND transporter periplasmic adaptor subunit n=1 Tax=uncultured Flavobacterium sp. TaxID=165435 RepID=UPI000915DD97|nr:efflux RND transporter periplasmic adaptor subunit [uncultured Flavobacterium sp.]OIQ22512.1 MAG: efflux transporter periplasmic adaptor subunit [Flavobacterium sp. MedPE-SWcel]
MKFNNLVILLLFTVTLFSSCKEKIEEKEPVLRPVKFEIVNTANAKNIRTFSGTAKAGDEIELSFRSNGIITSFDAKVGQQVKKGQLIAKLDNVQANLAYEQSISAVNSAKSAKNTAKSNLERIKSLYEKGSNSLSDYEAAKNSYQSALDQYESAQRNKGIQSSQISYGYIKAPKTGIIAVKNNEINDNVSAGQVIAVLNAGKDINVVVGLPENVINKTTLNMNAELTFSAIEGETFKGNVIEIAPVADVNSATYLVKVDITNPPKTIKPGMATNVTFDFSTTEVVADESLIVPVKAVGEDGNGNYVFIIESADGKTGQVKKHPIKIGELTTGGFKVVSGLKSGDKIATAGLQTLLDGQKVRLQ